MGKHLLLILRPRAAGDNSDLDDPKQLTEKRRHLPVERGLAFGECPVEIEYDETFHGSSAPAISNSVTERSGRKRQVPKDADKSSTPPCRIAKSMPPNSTLPLPAIHTKIRGSSAATTRNGNGLLRRPGRQ